jgi:nicotinamidase-related amidase
MSRKALFVIDIQHELAGDPQTRVPHAERIHVAGEQILSTARRITDEHLAKNQVSPFIIIFVQHEEPATQGSLVRDTEPWKLVFNPRPGVSQEVLVAKTHRKS